MIDIKKFSKVYQDQYVKEPYREYVNLYARCRICGEDHFVKRLPARDGLIDWQSEDTLRVNGHTVEECITCAAREDPPRILW
jgi:hypothetical protein